MKGWYPQRELITVELARSSYSNRELFLHELVRDYTPRIKSMIAMGLGKSRGRFSLNEAKQAFMIQANKAIDTAILTDDGRGKNDPRKWCGRSGLDNVRKTISRLYKRMQMERDNHIVLDLLEPNSYDAEKYFGISQDIASIVVGEDIVKQFMLTLTTRERLVVELLLQGYGPKQKLRECGKQKTPHYNYLKTIAEKLGWDQYKVARTIQSLRRKAAFLNG